MDSFLGVQHFFPISAVETLNESVLIGFARLDKLDFDSLIFGPIFQVATGKLRSVVDSDLLGQPPFGFELFKDTDPLEGPSAMYRPQWQALPD